MEKTFLQLLVNQTKTRNRILLNMTKANVARKSHWIKSFVVFCLVGFLKPLFIKSCSRFLCSYLKVMSVYKV